MSPLPRRQFLTELAATVAFASPAGISSVPVSTEPAWRVQRLSWAGLRAECGDITLFVDPWITPASWGGGWTEPVVPIGANAARRFALVTHFHNDHFDPAALREALGDRGSVVCDIAIADVIASRGFRVRPVRVYEPLLLGDVTVTAVPAVDGVNDPQVSWLVNYRGRRLLHAGDTLWHGAWWQIRTMCAPVDIAFLPINGARLRDRLPDSGVHAVMLPEEAAAAAAMVDARVVVPIHYGFHQPGTYEETTDAVRRFERAVAARRLRAAVLAPGEWISVDGAEPAR